MKQHSFLIIIYLCCMAGINAQQTPSLPYSKKIYRKGWIDYNKNGKKDIYEDARCSIDQRVEDLLRQMTLEEKLYQMSSIRLGEGDEIFQSSGEYSMDDIRTKLGSHGVGQLSCPVSDMEAGKSVSTGNQILRIAIEETRLGIPPIIDGEALHGCRALGATSYPQSIAMSCTWNPQLMHQIAEGIGQETYSRSIRQVFSPTLDLARDPRHGRMEECYGEDPYLASRMGVAFIKGVQSQGVICAPKHFLANFVAEGGRDSGHVGIGERELRELHAVPFHAAITEGKARSIMAAYNAIDGVPCSANRWLLTDLLRHEWGFDGYVVSDWSAVIHTFGHHRIAPTPLEAATRCVKAGLDMELPRLNTYVRLAEMINQHKLTEEDINTNVRHILRTKLQMGLFEHPYVDEKQAGQLCDAPHFRALAHEAARQSIVLLKNDKKLLPLTHAQRIAVIGPNANVTQLGGYSARGVRGITPLEGIKNHFGHQAVISYAKGCAIRSTDQSGFAEAIQAAQDADVCILIMGGAVGTTGGETRDRNTLDLMGVQEDLIEAIAQTGKPMVVVLVDGRPVTMTQWMDKADAIVMMFYAGEEGGNALGEILHGTTNPSGKLSISYPRCVGDLPMCLLHRPYGREGHIVEYGLGAMPQSRYFPLYPFGYGLSYTTYEYKNLQLTSDLIKPGDTLQFTVDITNTGTMDGDEIVQVYLTDLYCRITQPEKRLKAFQRIHVPAGETRTVSFSLPYVELSFLNERLSPEVETGEFELLVGPHCMDGVTRRFMAE